MTKNQGQGWCHAQLGSVQTNPKSAVKNHMPLSRLGGRGQHIRKCNRNVPITATGNWVYTLHPISLKDEPGTCFPFLRVRVMAGISILCSVLIQHTVHHLCMSCYVTPSLFKRLWCSFHAVRVSISAWFFFFLALFNYLVVLYRKVSNAFLLESTTQFHWSITEVCC